MKTSSIACALALSLTPFASALAAPPPPPPAGMPAGHGRPDGPPMDRAQLEKMLRKIHTMAVVELGEILDLDTAGTIKLSERLSRYEDQRLPLRLENWEAMQQVKRAARGEATADTSGLARKMAANRVALAQIDQKELEDVLTGLAPEKAAKVALFLTQFPKRIEHMAHEARMGGRPGGGERGDE
jgi:hypothetical protein